MSKRMANLMLLAVTFCWATQYIFIGMIPKAVSAVEFTAITNLLGCLLLAAATIKKLPLLTGKLLSNCIGLAVVSFGFNLLLTDGARELEASAASFWAAAYILFIPLFWKPMGRNATLENWFGILLVLAGLYCASGLSFQNMLKPGIILILGADCLFAFYLIILEIAVKKYDPLLLAVGQLFFSGILGVIVWLIFHAENLFWISWNKDFWISAIAIAIFVRGFSTIMQLYAQKYVSALHASLLFSTETVMTFVLSLFMPALFHLPLEVFSVYKGTGCLLVAAGVLVNEGYVSRLMIRKGAKSVAELKVCASVDKLDEVIAFIHEQLYIWDCSQAFRTQMDLIAEEIFVNIANYAYHPEEGEVIIRCTAVEKPSKMILQFEDSGKPYNPLLMDMPDISLDASQREVGGLGIFIVKDLADEISYDYQQGRNCLTVEKKR